jgi:hypothetical protein
MAIGTWKVLSLYKTGVTAYRGNIHLVDHKEKWDNIKMDVKEIH